jgi:hypothetical protein
MQLRFNLLIILSLVAIAMTLFNCTDKYPPAPAEQVWQFASQSSCVTCHLNKELLKQVATPVEPPSESGEG